MFDSLTTFKVESNPDWRFIGVRDREAGVEKGVKVYYGWKLPKRCRNRFKSVEAEKAEIEQGDLFGIRTPTWPSFLDFGVDINKPEEDKGVDDETA